MEDRRSPKKHEPVASEAKESESEADTPGDIDDEVEPDFPGVDVNEDGDPMIEQLEEYVQIGQIHGNYTLDPVTSIHDISHMAGYGGDGFDAMGGIDLLVMGDVDAAGELEAPSATTGGPLKLDENESILNDDSGHGDMALFTEPETGDGVNWTEYMMIEDEETLV